ncbi:hypothetical protein [Deinococcus radiotolerans]|uniref:Uncharacterized protein n=1 Tax=Deinococcus radiotolerans TaxID=1309407 RepID=A0ABQ2FFP9_9DEIO|nr:hypothetical protein [Deinococcus radiotolerans]GGK91323.1 hypothetical protein GCM10010844_07290 [Deinococcus radiotolerans]
MTVTYLFATWARVPTPSPSYPEDTGISWTTVTGSSGLTAYLNDDLEGPIALNEALNAWCQDVGISSAQTGASSGPNDHAWYVQLPAPLPNYPYDPMTGEPIPDPNQPGPGVGGPWAGGLGAAGVDGSPAPPPPPPRPYGDCTGQTYLMLSGLPITTATRAPQRASDGHLIPGSNGMEAPAKLWSLIYAEGAGGLLDFTQPPTRFMQQQWVPAADGQVLWSGVGITGPNLELEPLPVVLDGVTYTPAQRYYRVPTGCGDAGVPVTYLPQPGPGLLEDPVRVQLGEDQSGLFRDNRVSLTYPDRAPVSLSTPYRIGLEVEPTQGVMSFELSSRRLDTDSGLVEWTGETILGRLSRIYPFPEGFFRTGPFTARGALEVLLGEMRATYDWLGWEDLPEFYLRGDGELFPVWLQALVIEAPQDGPGPSAQDVLKMFFEPFGGYGFRVSRWGRLEVIAPPWASGGVPEPALTLTNLDLTEGGTSTLDDSQVVNVCTVTSQGYVFQEGEVLPPASVRIGTHYDATGVDVGSALWQPADGVHPGGGPLSIQVHATVWADTGFIGPDRELDGGTQTVSLPMTPGATVTATFNVSYSAFSSSQASVTFTVTNDLAVRVTPRLIRSTNPTRYDYLFEFTATGQTFGRSATKIVATYGETETGVDLAASLAEYGRRELTLDTGVYQIDAATALSMARAVVTDRMNPREVLTLSQAPPYPVRPEHVGRLIDVPGARGLVTGWSYSEAHTPQQSQSSSQFTLSVEQRLVLNPVPLPGGDTLNRATERRYHRARWGAVRLKE